MKAALLLVLFGSWVTQGADFAALSADRAAIERVYHNHRTGTKPPFEQAVPPALIQRLVKEDLKKEAVLKREYGIEMTSALLEGEVARINATTRAPEMLSEIKTALGDDPARFSHAFAKPILVERLLRDKFDNDDALHASQRRQVEQTRNELLAAKTNGANGDKLVALLKRSHFNAVSETTWQLGTRPEPPVGAETAEAVEIKKRFGPDAKLLSHPHEADGEARPFYFADLPGELQNVLRLQLRQPGDVSAVIETHGGFLLYVAKEKTDALLSVASLSLPKRGYEQWLAEQSETKP